MAKINNAEKITNKPPLVQSLSYFEILSQSDNLFLKNDYHLNDYYFLRFKV